MTKLAATLPKGDGNGLDAIARKLFDLEEDLRAAFPNVDPKTGEIRDGD